MAVSFKKLWKLLICLSIEKKDLQQAAGVRSSLLATLGRKVNVSPESFCKIFTARHCDFGDYMAGIYVS